MGSSETRVAVLEDDRLTELLLGRNDESRTIGNVFKGRVTDVLPGIQSAFVEIGFERKGFLHINDLAQSSTVLHMHEDVLDGYEEPSRQGNTANIQDLLKEGQEILVQVAKDPIGGKGAKLTTAITLPGRYLVLMPGVKRVAISHRIDESEERERLKSIAERFPFSPHGFIVRTAAQGKSEEVLVADARALVERWEGIIAKAEKSSAPILLYKDLGMIHRMLRDVFTEEVESLIVDDVEEYENIVNSMDTLTPGLSVRVKLYDGEFPLFDEYRVEQEIERIIRRKVWLRSGGYIVIDQAEAMVAIDVNTGRFVGKEDPEQTILQTNLEAAREIARQVRLRDIGGIIIIDFIDMKSEQDRQRVLDALREAVRPDRSRTKIMEISQLGLVEMTRKRVRESLTAAMTQPCPSCRGRGRVLSSSSLIIHVEREINRRFMMSSSRKLLVSLNPDTFEEVKEKLIATAGQLERAYQGEVNFKTDESLALDEVEIDIHDE